MTYKDALAVEHKINNEMSKLACVYYQQLVETEGQIVEIFQDYPEDIRKAMIPFHLHSINAQLDGMIDFTKCSMQNALNGNLNKEES